MVYNTIKVHRNALIEAWLDGKVPGYEYASIEHLRKSLNITPGEHLEVEESGREELVPRSPETQRAFGSVGGLYAYERERRIWL